MSADNGIYILPLKNEIYLVTEACAIENIYDYPNTPVGYNLRKLRDYFNPPQSYRAVKVVNARNLALAIAREEFDNAFHIEHGIVWLEYLDLTYDELCDPNFEYPVERMDELDEDFDDVLLTSYLYNGAVVTLIRTGDKIKITSYKCDMVHPIGFVHETNSTNPILELSAPVGIKFVSRLLTVLEQFSL